MENFVNDVVSQSYFIHTYEGDDDMPAHIKSSIFWSKPNYSLQMEKTKSELARNLSWRT